MPEYRYDILWEQNMGGGRGILARASADEWEVAKLIWERCCTNQLPNTVRDARVNIFVNDKFSHVFNPDGRTPWPRPSAISS